MDHTSATIQEHSPQSDSYGQQPDRLFQRCVRCPEHFRETRAITPAVRVESECSFSGSKKNEKELSNLLPIVCHRAVWLDWREHCQHSVAQVRIMGAAFASCPFDPRTQRRL